MELDDITPFDEAETGCLMVVPAPWLLGADLGVGLTRPDEACEAALAGIGVGLAMVEEEGAVNFMFTEEG